MKLFSLIIFSCFLGVTSFAQSSAHFRPFYFNFGINMPAGNFGKAPLTSSNAEQNIVNGYYGAKKLGYLFEFGTKIYFNNSSHKLRYGLDWTFLSANYNEMDWTSYMAAKGGAVTEPRVYSLSTKLGPVISYNIVAKLIVDAHFQIAPVAHYATFEYFKQSGADTEDFNFKTDKIGDVYGGIKTSTGIGVKWGVIGLAADYFTGKLNTSYEYDNTAAGSISNGLKKVKITTSTIQLKLTLNM
ncbi:MAG: hypothetical protein ABJB86_05915 [Bacteroidota bacterium]